MGIKGFKQFLRSKFPQTLQPYHLSHLQGKKVAIDILPYLYKFKASMGDRWKEGILTFLLSLLKNNIHATIFTDGPFVTHAKKDEQDKRRNQRATMVEKVKDLTTDLQQFKDTGAVSDRLKALPIEASSQRNLLLGLPEDYIDTDLVQNYIDKISKQIIFVQAEDISDIKELCTVMNISFHTAKSEAESMCSYLCMTGQVDAVITEDSDVMAYGAPVWISSIDMNGDCIKVDLEHMLAEMGNWTHSQLVDFCIMCGTDYNSSIPKIGPVSAYGLIGEHKTIEQVCQIKGVSGEELKKELSRELFTNPCAHAVIVRNKKKGKARREKSTRREDLKKSKVKREFMVQPKYNFRPERERVLSYLRSHQYHTRYAMDYLEDTNIVLEE